MNEKEDLFYSCCYYRGFCYTVICCCIYYGAIYYYGICCVIYIG